MEGKTVKDSESRFHVSFLRWVNRGESAGEGSVGIEGGCVHVLVGLTRATKVGAGGWGGRERDDSGKR